MANSTQRNSKLEAINEREWTGQLLTQEKSSPPTCASQQACDFLGVEKHTKREQLAAPTSSTWLQAWKKGRDKQKIRVATNKKVPFRKKWQLIKERLTNDQLLKKYGEYGERTGIRYQRYYDCRLDFDFWGEKLPKGLKENFYRQFLAIIGVYRVKWGQTKHGGHVDLLLEERPPNGIIEATDKYGQTWQVGSLLSKGRQARATCKEERGEGAWAIKRKNISQIKNLFEKFYFNIRLTEKTTQKSQLKTKTNIKVYQPLKRSENISESIMTGIILDRLKLPMRGQKQKPLYKIKYQTSKGQKRYFLLDTEYNGRTPESIIGDLIPGAERTFILNQGRKHQFLKKLILW